MRALLPDRRRHIRWFLLVVATMLAGCSSGSRQLLSRAEADWRNGRYEEAIQANADLLRIDRGGKYTPRALLNIANIYYLNLRKLKEAIEFYDRLTREYSDSPEALAARRSLAGIYANEVIDLNQAIVQYDKLLESKSLDDRDDILFQRADVYFKQEDYYRALRELFSLEESGVSGHLADQVSLKIGNIYEIQKQFPKAIEPFRKVLTATCPECRRRAVLNLTETYENLLDFDNAIETIRKLDKTPENEDYIKREVARLSERRKKAESSSALDWNHPQENQSAAGATATASPRKRSTPPVSPPSKKIEE